MSTAVIANRTAPRNPVAEAALNAAARFWFVVAVIGQWAFLFYIAAFYGPSTFTGNFQAWTRNPFPLRAYAAGDTIGNLAFAAHALLAGVIAFGGALQLVPQIRTRAISLHRWIGRLFVVTAFGLSATGLYMTWIRNHSSLSPSSVAVSLNAVLIFLFCGLAWRSAVRHEVSTHRRWALRAYLVANAQWFTRVGVFAWILVNRGPVGIGDNFDGPVIIFWSFGCYLVPLAVLELYLRAQEHAGTFRRMATAAVLFVLTLATGTGILGVTMAAWLPSVKAAYDPRKSIAQTLSATIASRGVDQAVKQYHELKASAPAVYIFAEKELNNLGYDLIRTKKFNAAIRIFQLNVEAYPQSGNVYDSLAEAYLDAGDKPQAIANYEKSLQLNPKNRNARQMLQRLNTQ
jgi:uncharacterized membrane protein